MLNNTNQPLFDVKATSKSNVGTTTCASSRNVLTKASDEVTIKSYFEGVHELLKTKGSDAFCVNLDEVWPLVYERKDHAIRHLTNGDYFEGVDFQASQKGKVVSINNLQNGINTTIMVTVPTLETLIARKERRVFEVYRQVFHQAMSTSQKTRCGETFTANQSSTIATSRR